MKNKNSNNNILNGSTFNGPANVNINVGDSSGNLKGGRKNGYRSEPIFSIPKNVSVVSLLGTILSMIQIMLGFLSSVLGKISLLFEGVKEVSFHTIKKGINEIQIPFVFFFLLSFFIIMMIGYALLRVLRISENKLRYPLFNLFNFAISGKEEGKIVIEKIKVNCHFCGGDMKFYNKNKKPILECKRNSGHWYRFDPTWD